MKYILLFALFILCVIEPGICQYRLKDIPFNLNEINKLNEKGRQGVWFFYEKSDSTVLSMKHFRNDTLDGYFEEYWRNGRISNKGYYTKGLLDSVFLSFWENGEKKFEGIYKNGLLNGIVKTYFRNGGERTKEKYVKGVIDKNFTDSFIDDTIIADFHGNNKHDTLIEKFNVKWNKRISIYENGNIIKQQQYYQNRLIIESLYSNGTLYKRIIYSKKKVGKIVKVHLYVDGELSSTIIYR